MKKNLLLLHGALGSKKQFEVLKPLLENEFDIYDFNFSGHGGEPRAKEFSVNAFSSELITFIENHNLPNLHIFGYSMGGYIALKAALQIPEKILKIVTLGTKFDWSKEATGKEIKMLNPDVIETKVPQFANKLKEDHAPEDWKVIMKDTANLMIKLSEGEQLQPDEFSKIHTNITLGLGKSDKMVSKEETIDVCSLLPNGEFVELENVKHPIESIDPEQLANYLKEVFL